MKTLITLLIVLQLTACGGGGGGSSSTTDTDTSTTTTTTSLTNQQIIKADTAWANSKYGYNVLVAVVDTGVRSTHEAFTSGRVRTDLGYDFDGTTATTTDPASGEGHGTAVASIVIGSQASKVGVASSAEVIPLKICISSCVKSTTDNVQYKEALDWANTQGAKVINYSLFTPFSSTDLSPSANDPLFDALVSTGTNNIVVVLAAGNNGSADPVQPALNADESLYGGNLIAVGNVLVDRTTGTVTGMDSTSNRAGSAKNKYIVAPGLATVASHTSDTGYKSVNGTSFAAPLVAGAAALIRESYPSLTAAQVVQILLKSATDLGATGVDEVYGYGLLNVQAALTLAATY